MTTVPGITSSTTSATATATKNALGQDEFLTLLVAQLQNQDPLNPADATEFTSQLAQYSQLEQLFNLNDSMDQLAAAQNSSERISTLSLIGQDVIVEGSDFTLGDDAVQIGYKVDGTVAGIDIAIQNSTGKTVATLTANDREAGNHFITWDGLGTNGAPLPPGDYSFVINTKSSGETTATVSPLVRTEVTGVDLSSSDPMIVTNLGEYKVSSLYGAYNNNQKNATTE
jgi:flagellar basal-body rod modification protein FlgD